MHRTTISLPEDVAKALEREARRRSVPMSTIARDAISKHLGLGAAGERRELPFAGIGRSGQRTTSREMEDLIEREWDPHARRR